MQLREVGVDQEGFLAFEVTSFGRFDGTLFYRLIGVGTVDHELLGDAVRLDDDVFNEKIAI